MNDYSTLAQRVSSSASGIRGCLLLSRDGLVLAADPEGDAESQLKAAWVRFATIGEPDRSYVEFPDQTWAYVRRGSYAAFAVADAGVRPGILIDLLEQALMAGEQERTTARDTMRIPEIPSAPSGKPRTSLHLPSRATASPPEPLAAEVTVPEAEQRAPGPADPGSDPAPSEGGGEDVAAAVHDAETETETGYPDESPPNESATDPPPGRDPEVAPPAAGEEESEVDRILLAKEFAGLLQVPKEDDEASR